VDLGRDLFRCVFDVFCFAVVHALFYFLPFPLSKSFFTNLHNSSESRMYA
jgi:hypothetical protein